MRHEPLPGPKRPLDLSVDGSLIEEASALAIDMPEVVEAALRREIAAEKARRWRAENAEAIAFNNRELEANGLWSDDYRLF